MQLVTVVSIHNVFGADGITPQLVNETKNFAYCVQLETVTEPKTATITVLRLLFKKKPIKNCIVWYSFQFCINF